MPHLASPAATLLSELLPGRVRGAERFDDALSAPLHAVEERYVARAIPRRRQEFATARLCARRALEELGAGDCAVPSGPDGEPVWPSGVVGSITHCEGYRAAAVGWADGAPALGIDAEPNATLPTVVLRKVADASELRALEALSDADGVCWDRLLWSAKESLLKACWGAGHPVLLAELGVAIDAGGTFSPLLPRSTGGAVARVLGGLRGRWLQADGLLVTTAIADERPDLAA